jgi:RNA polymerase sigma-70 factor (ECF subfamily)
MNLRLRRSRDVSSVATATAAAAPAPAKAESSRTQFEQLYRQSRDDVYAYVAGLMRDRSAAEEVTAIAFERAWSRRRQIDPERGSARAWLFGIARNAALDELRRRSRLASLPQDHADSEASGRAPRAAGGDPAQIAVRRTTLRQAMTALNGRERELIALKFFAGLSNAEIAEVIGVSETNAGTKLHRTIEKLRRACDEAA